MAILEVVVQGIHRSGGRLHPALGVSLGKRCQVVVVCDMPAALEVEERSRDDIQSARDVCGPARARRR